MSSAAALPSGVPSGGFVAPGFEPVRAAFARNFADAPELGAAVCVMVDGRAVVDLWGGWFDVERTRPYGDDALQLVFSTTKGVAAAAVAMLVDREQLAYEAPVARYWPEFAAAGKDAVSVAQLLSHQAGVPVIDAALTLAQALQWDTVAGALAAQAPVWPPGTAHGYHALTFGWLVGELVRRVDGRDLGRFVADEIAGPLGLSLWIGLPEHLEARVSPVTAPADVSEEAMAVLDLFAGPSTLLGRALSLDGALPVPRRPTDDMVWNRRDVHAAQLPAANGITDARSLARLYSALLGEVDGVRLVSGATVDRLRTTAVRGPDRCLLVETAFGMGVMTHCALSAMAGPGSFGHSGAGGSWAFAQPERGLAFAYVMNVLDPNLLGDTRAANLITAALSCL